MFFLRKGIVMSTKYSQEIKSEKVLITIDENLLKKEQKKLVNKINLFNYRLIVKIPFDKYKKIGQIIINEKEIQEVIESGNIRHCCKSTI